MFNVNRLADFRPTSLLCIDKRLRPENRPGAKAAIAYRSFRLKPELVMKLAKMRAQRCPGFYITIAGSQNPLDLI
jgi:hypothetical protein